MHTDQCSATCRVSVPHSEHSALYAASLKLAQDAAAKSLACKLLWLSYATTHGCNLTVTH
jgi:hypothetical protein